MFVINISDPKHRASRKTTGFVTFERSDISYNAMATLFVPSDSEEKEYEVRTFIGDYSIRNGIFANQLDQVKSEVHDVKLEPDEMGTHCMSLVLCLTDYRNDNLFDWVKLYEAPIPVAPAPIPVAPAPIPIAPAPIPVAPAPIPVAPALILEYLSILMQILIQLG